MFNLAASVFGYILLLYASAMFEQTDLEERLIWLVRDSFSSFGKVLLNSNIFRTYQKLCDKHSDP
jgi:hypothetical protein